MPANANKVFCTGARVGACAGDGVTFDGVSFVDVRLIEHKFSRLRGKLNWRRELLMRCQSLPKTSKADQKYYKT